MSWVHVPIPQRPATPWMHSFAERPRYWGEDEVSGMGGLGLDPSKITGDITDVFRTVYSSQPGMYTEQLPNGTIVTYRQPEGSTATLPVGRVSGTLQTGVQGTLSSGAGVWILLGVGVVLLIMMRKR